MDTALQIRKNAEELKSYLADLSSWETEIKQKDKIVKGQKVFQTNVPPIRGQNAPVDVGRGGAGMVGTPNQKVPTTVPKLKAYDYTAWDKFDVNEALNQIDQKPSPPTPPPTTTKIIPKEEPQVERALIEKEKGNEWFKRGDYKRAVQCYTKAISADSSSAVYYINRAMAHLKLTKFEEAEEDCTRGLDFEPKNVKALWRRGIARSRLGKFEDAKKDWETALILDPANKAVKDELNALLVLKIKNNAKELDKPPRRRRLEIEEIDEGEEGGEGVVAVEQPDKISGLKAVSTRSLKKPEKSTTPSTITEVSSAPSPNPPSLQSHSTTTEKKPTPLIPSPHRTHPIPTTMFEFSRAYKSLKHDPEGLYTYLSRIPTRTFPTIFKNSLESDYLATIFGVLAHQYMRDGLISEIAEMLAALSRLPRFDMAVMFLSRRDKTVLGEVLERLSGYIPPSDINDLRRVYKV
ncbi:hypothetical protein DFS34DRAFT_597821 [Phlyctochytrium arcticum]|nr:hypothetical protein DFS34DRAFT_597821 [Phlyctochytrium arcticum]